MFTIPDKLLKSNNYCLYALSFLLLIQACEKSSSPLESLSAQYTSHDYEWEIDTLEASDAMQIYMYDIWGTDENNVWTVGHSDDFDYQIWHWEGIEWTSVNPRIVGDRPSFSEMIGFSANDLWVVGSGVYQIGLEPELRHREYILHFNGIEWTRYINIKAPPCLSVWGPSKNELYFGCDSGVVLYKNEQTWQKQSIGNDAQIVSIWGFSPSQVFAVGYSWSTSQYYFFERTPDDWAIIDYGNLKFGHFLWGLDFDHFFSVGGRGLYEYIDSKWVNIFPISSLNCIYGSHSNDIFIGGYRNKIHHFNGENWYHFAEFDNENQEVDGIWCNSSSVFIVIGDLLNTYILKGMTIAKNQTR